jgi:hypothetical protein
VCVWEKGNQRKYIPHRRQSKIVRKEFAATVLYMPVLGPLTSYVIFPGRQALLLALYRNLFTGTLIKKENQIFLICKEIQNGAVAKSYMRKGFLIYEEMRKSLLIYEEAVSHI